MVEAWPYHQREEASRYHQKEGALFPLGVEAWPYHQREEALRYHRQAGALRHHLQEALFHLLEGA